MSVHPPSRGPLVRIPRAAVGALALSCALAACARPGPANGPTLGTAASGPVTSPDQAAGDDAASEAPAPAPRVAIECNRDDFGPAQLSPEHYALRHGADVRSLAELTSSMEQPVEVCHVRGQQEYLLQATCADGSSPLPDATAVRRARSGSMGPGGRCNAIIDLYEVPCPEKTYEVYMDMYFCPADTAPPGADAASP